MPSITDFPSVEWIKRPTSKLLIGPNATYSDFASQDGTLWLFLDESGNFDFTDKGTKYFIMTCLAVRRPFQVCHDLMDAKYDFFENGVIMKKFHATEDNGKVRSSVYGIIERYAGALSAYSIYVNKKSIPQELMDAGKLYEKVFEWITDEALRREASNGTSKVIVVTDELPKEAKKKQVSKPLKKMLKDFTQRTGIESYLEHFPSESDYNLQIADYLCWAFMRKEASGKDWPYSKVESIFTETGRLSA